MNNLKRKLELTAAIIGIIFASVMTLVLGYMFFAMVLLGEVFATATGVNSISFTFLCIVILIMLILVVAEIVLGAMLCKSPKVSSDGTVQSRFGLDLAFTIIAGIGSIIWYTSIPILIIVLCPVVLMIISMCLKNKAVPPVIDGGLSFIAPDDNSIDSKLAELKKFKDLGIIDEEQYNKSVANLIKNQAEQ